MEFLVTRPYTSIPRLLHIPHANYSARSSDYDRSTPGKRQALWNCGLPAAAATFIKRNPVHQFSDLNNAFGFRLFVRKATLRFYTAGEPLQLATQVLLHQPGELQACMNRTHYCYRAP